MIKAVKKRYIVLAVIVAVLLALFFWTLWQNTALQVNSFAVSSRRVPQSFDGFRIAHVSDLHNAVFGEDNEVLLQLLAEAEPDVIAITGDIADSRHTDINAAVSFAQQAAQIAPCYYVTGNHEAWLENSDREQLEQGLSAAGVITLRDSEVKIERGSDYISLVGVDDPLYAAEYDGAGARMEPAELSDLAGGDSFTVLLSHRPEYFEQYAASDIDLVLCGHVHGGQFRLPFVGGLVSPDIGLFPKYDAGEFTENGTTMIVSRGIGNSVIPLRFNNPPEIVLIQLEYAD